MQMPLHYEILGNLNNIREEDIVRQVYSFKALISENELKYLMTLAQKCGINIDFKNARDEDIKNFIE